MSNAWTVAARFPGARPGTSCPHNFPHNFPFQNHTTRLARAATYFITAVSTTTTAAARRSFAWSATRKDGLSARQNSRSGLQHTSQVSGPTPSSSPMSRRSASIKARKSNITVPPIKRPKTPTAPKRAPRPPRPSADRTTQEQTNSPYPPLPTGDLSRTAIHNLFGAQVPTSLGNSILRALQHRRESGSLVEYGVSFSDLPATEEEAREFGAVYVSPAVLAKALMYLRERFPVDEELSAALWADEEASRLERGLRYGRRLSRNRDEWGEDEEGRLLASPDGESVDLEGREVEGEEVAGTDGEGSRDNKTNDVERWRRREGVETSLQRPGGKVPKTPSPQVRAQALEDVEETMQGTPYGRAKSAHSFVEENTREAEKRTKKQVEEYEKKWQREDAERMARKRPMIGEYQDGKRTGQLPNPETGVGAGTLQTGGGSGELAQYEENRWWHHYEDKARELEDIPDTSPLKRLLPSTLFTLVVLGLCTIFASAYEPPPTSARLFPDLPPSIATVGAVVLANTAVFVAFRFPPLWRFFNRYFTIVPSHPRAPQVLGAMWAHRTSHHFMMNMAAGSVIGVILHEYVGRGNFLAIWVACGTFGSWASLTKHVLMADFLTYICGASPAVYACAAAALTVNPDDHLNIPLVDVSLPIPPKLVLAVLMLVEGVALVRGRNKGVDRMAHFAGYGSGAVAGTWVKRGIEKRVAAENVSNGEEVEERKLDEEAGSTETAAA
ncbi:hypothetical protein BDY21DRAFT_333274 [Lineolata rhizophorae]|uniref:Peptidase S54 rhomboid domain-containing protein n=1 Tax=Lineolata rhizophorae TaxID=578093 RepID=A0A6A6P9S8_9PEZI|nr:hypothetical protein BDY21DRAFT_333274 [Lineolata rhizophorae]